MSSQDDQRFDLFVIGGGINGAGIARDAAGRGYSVALAEMNDFASGTSSASTKLFHGGLRYLEYFEFRLVREALIEREKLLKAMPHISWPMRFVLPLHPDMRFDNDTPTSRLLSAFMPWLKGRRPQWIIRLGLFLYDNLGGREILPGTRSIDLRNSAEGRVLDGQYQRAYEYSDCWVEDSRLTLLNVVDAHRNGARIFARTRVISALQQQGKWQITLEDENGLQRQCEAAMIVNAAGPWVEDVLQNVTRVNSRDSVRLVRGSHIIVRSLYDHGKCYFFQGTDGRIMFAIPYEEDYTLIGTTDVEHANLEEPPVCTEAEEDYMIAFVNTYFRRDITRDDVVWKYSGVRPLYDDNADSATAATRDYVLKMAEAPGAPLLNIFGGKITTYRKLAESALEEIDAALSRTTQPWTEGRALPGGDFALSELPSLIASLSAALPFFDAFTHRRLVRQYGTAASDIFAGAQSPSDLGTSFGHGVTAREIDWAIEHEWVRCAEDFLWRRSKLGLRFTPSESQALERYIAAKVPGGTTAATS